MKITEIRKMLDLMKQLIDEGPIEVNVSEEELNHYKELQRELYKKELLDTFNRFAFYKPQ
jgi:hypothetical protein